MDIHSTPVCIQLWKLVPVHRRPWQVHAMQGYLLSPCEDILNTMRGYPQHLARISSTPREDILIFFQTPN